MWTCPAQSVHVERGIVYRHDLWVLRVTVHMGIFSANSSELLRFVQVFVYLVKAIIES